MPRSKCVELTEAESTSGEDGKKKLVCKICGDKATGRNFGVLSCESCKAFFRRNARRESSLKCPFESPAQCVMNMKIRRFCMKCRIKKCFTEGMNMERIESEEKLMARKRRKEAKKEKEESTKAVQALILKAESLDEPEPPPKILPIPKISIQSPADISLVHAPKPKVEEHPMDPRIFRPSLPMTPHFENPCFNTYGPPNRPFLTPPDFWMQHAPMNGHYSGTPSPRHRSPYFSQTPSPNWDVGMYASPNEMLMQMIQHGHHYLPEPELPDLSDLPDFRGFGGGQEMRNRHEGAGYTQLN